MTIGTILSLQFGIVIRPLLLRLLLLNYIQWIFSVLTAECRLWSLPAADIDVTVCHAWLHSPRLFLTAAAIEDIIITVMYFVRIENFIIIVMYFVRIEDFTITVMYFVRKILDIFLVSIFTFVLRVSPEIFHVFL